MDRCKGDRWTDEQLRSYIEGRIKKLDHLYEQLLMFPKSPDDIKARIWEVEAARRFFGLLVRGKEKEAIKWLRALPTSLGGVTLLVDDLVVHLGIGYLNRKVGDRLIPVSGARSVHSEDPWAWQETRQMLKDLGMPKGTERPLAWLNEKGYKPKLEGIGMITCIGHAQLSVDFDNPSDWRTFKNLKVVNARECGVEILANEPFHRYRCRDCNDTFLALRGVGRNRRGRNMTRGQRENALNKLLSVLDD